MEFSPTPVGEVVTYKTLLSVENPDGLLRPGMTATVVIQTGKREDVLRVPARALWFKPPKEVRGFSFGPPQRNELRDKAERGSEVYVPQGQEAKKVILQVGRSDDDWGGGAPGARAGRSGDRGGQDAARPEGVVVSERPIVEMHEIHKIYGSGAARVDALAGVSFKVMPGEFVAVMGPSGSGKSTCMNITGCLDLPSLGHYRFLGVEVGELDRGELALLRRHYLGFVFQSFNLIARTSATKNVELPLIYKGISRRKRRAMANASLATVGLGDRVGHTPAELSGGQQQRVAIARALVSQPRLLLADEPTGNLDTKTSEEILGLMVTLNQTQGLTIMMVTHEPEAAQFAQRVLLFTDGKLVADGSPHEVL